MSRHAGMVAPLFSVASSESWGIGELCDVGTLAAWLAGAGFDRLMLLPIGPMPPGETSPYSASSSMAIDPVFIGIGRVEDFLRAGGIDALDEGARGALDRARSSARVDYAAVRAAKDAAIDLAFDRFVRDEWETLTPRAGAFAGFIARERWWLDDYALFAALVGSSLGPRWTEWPAPVRDRDPKVLDELRRQFGRAVLREQYAQWLADVEWQAAHAEARAHGVAIFGDVPFAMTRESVDVWVRAAEFDLDVSIGVPADAFSDTGQDWGLPGYRWDVIAASDFAWLRHRARRMAALVDGVRIDHLVGFYRTYARASDGRGGFSPEGEGAQTRQGEAILRLFVESGVHVVAEDLGVVPDFVRASLARLEIPGYAVLRWARAWNAPDRPFRDPAGYDPRSVAALSTHDTESSADWWDRLSIDERRELTALPALREAGIDPAQGWSDRVRDALLRTIYGAGSNDMFLLAQDLFGWRERINTPATVSGANWTWRLPWPVDRLDTVEIARERAGAARELARWSARGARGR